MIALIVTIIVLLILAAVGIVTLKGENGIIKNAIIAKEETRGSSVQEQVDLWNINKKIDEMTESKTAQKLKELLDDLEKQQLIKSEERTVIETTGQVTIGSKTIVFGEEMKDNLVDMTKLKVGDYVDYTPDNDIPTGYDKFKEMYSGYANDNIGKDNALRWRILNIKEDTIDLISDKPISTLVYFAGVRGYNNGVYLLNDYCKTMYSNKDRGAVARSLNIEDIQDKMVIDNGKKFYESYGSGTFYEYGKSRTYNGMNPYFPLQWKNDNGIEGESKQDTLTAYITEEEAYYNRGDSLLEVTSTAWYAEDEITVKTNFEKADTRDEAKANSMYYELLCNNGELSYWLASRFTSTSSSAFPIFGLRNVYDGCISCNDLFNSVPGHYGESSAFVRPVVSIPANSIDTSTEYNESTGWK